MGEREREIDKIDSQQINSESVSKVNECTTFRTNSENIVTTVGKLKERISKWTEIGANTEILSIIENGYKLPLHTMPEEVELRNNRSALEHSKFVEVEIEINLKPTVRIRSILMSMVFILQGLIYQ